MKKFFVLFLFSLALPLCAMEASDGDHKESDLRNALLNELAFIDPVEADVYRPLLNNPDLPLETLLVVQANIESILRENGFKEVRFRDVEEREIEGRLSERWWELVDSGLVVAPEDSDQEDLPGAPQEDAYESASDSDDESSDSEDGVVKVTVAKQTELATLRNRIGQLKDKQVSVDRLERSLEELENEDDKTLLCTLKSLIRAKEQEFASLRVHTPEPDDAAATHFEKDDSQEGESEDDTDGVPLWALQSQDRNIVVVQGDAGEEGPTDGEQEVAAEPAQIELTGLPNHEERDAAQGAADELREQKIKAVPPTTNGRWLQRVVIPPMLGKTVPVFGALLVVGGLTRRHVTRQRALGKPTIFDRMRSWTTNRFMGKQKRPEPMERSAIKVDSN